MKLMNLLQKGRCRPFANAKVAKVAKDDTCQHPTLARLATLAGANTNTSKNNGTPTLARLATLAGVEDEISKTKTTGNDVESHGLDWLSPVLDTQQVAEVPDLDRYCWPHSSAMNGAEIDIFTLRTSQFAKKGVNRDDADQLADTLVHRDREGDDRRVCLECQHLTGYGATSWRCGNWQAAGIAIKARDAGLPAELVHKLQRCDGFTNKGGNT